jgi:hypothetical protein
MRCDLGRKCDDRNEKKEENWKEKGRKRILRPCIHKIYELHSFLLEPATEARHQEVWTCSGAISCHPPHPAPSHQARDTELRQNEGPDLFG